MLEKTSKILEMYSQDRAQWVPEHWHTCIIFPLSDDPGDIVHAARDVPTHDVYNMKALEKIFEFMESESL